MISGFLGPNGSGKTTTLRILMGFAHAMAGSASVLGVPAGSTHETFERVAFVPEVKDFYPPAKGSRDDSTHARLLSAMVWYSHWLEMRGGPLAALPLSFSISNSLLEGRVAWLGGAGLTIVAMTRLAISVTRAPQQEVA